MLRSAKAISTSGKGVTIAALRDALLGRKNTSRAQYAINFSELKNFGCLRNVGWSVEEVSVLLHQMVIHRVCDLNYLIINYLINYLISISI